MNYNNDYMTKSYYVEHDDFFKYIREYLQEESSHMYYIKHVDDSDISSQHDSDISSQHDSDENYDNNHY
tara:strand:+ start:306 stop:512 length:207 start_codon:yes stop_codon:yes gene_type:complete